MAPTLAGLIVNTVKTYPKPDLMLYKKDGAFTPMSTQEFGDGVKHLALGLKALGFEQGQKLCLLSENRPAWTMTDFATLCAGGLTVPIYTTLVPEQIRYIIEDSDATVVVVSNPDLWKKVDEAIGKGLGKTLGHEQRIVAESPRAAGGKADAALAGSLEQAGFRQRAGPGEARHRQRASEPGAALSLRLLENEFGP
ncbi:MAG: AMP-binding protein [Candidatus Aminicenantes bacterium]|nr:AMP-binding protein [Candidatus Aminicenantes bacterium]